MAGGLKPAVARDGLSAGLLTIDLVALAANWKLLRDRVAPSASAAVVKADAYGIGIEPAVRALAEAGCRTFFVAHLGEARRVRAVASGAEIYVLNGLLPGTADCYVGEALRPVLGSFDELDEWAALCRTAGRPLPAALHVDTGMNRLGFPAEAAGTLAGDTRLDVIAPALLMSHLTSAEEPDDPASARQMAQFAAIRPLFPGVPASLANSSGIFNPDVAPFDLVRPGYALYGGNPLPGRPNPMAPVVRLEASIIQVREVPAGVAIGYNGRWTAPVPRRLATLSIGYADGFRRTGSRTDRSDRDGFDRAAVLVDGTLCPTAGTVSMDLLIADVTTAGRAERGDRATLVGDALDVDEVGRRAGTIGYEILTGLGHRFERRYVGAT